MSQKTPSFVPNRVVIIASGGLDSTTLLYRLIAENKDIYAITFNYGQKHVKEIECASKICDQNHIPHKILSLETLTQAGIFGESSLISSNEIPEGNYDEANMINTVVPNRNMIMISLALAYAISIFAESIYYGAHAGDHAIYPDCRPEFVEAMQQAGKVCHYWPISIHAPYLYLPKTEIVKEGLTLKVDYSKTWTCYNGEAKACGKCGSCDERLKAFSANGVQDPLNYME